MVLHNLGTLMLKIILMMLDQKNKEVLTRNSLKESEKLDIEPTNTAVISIFIIIKMHNMPNLAENRR